MHSDEPYTVLESALQNVILRAAEMDELFVDFQMKFSQKNAELRQEQEAIRIKMDHIGIALSSNGSQNQIVEIRGPPGLEIKS